MAAPKEPVTLKQWMRKQDIFDNDLLAILTEQGVNTPDDFADYTQQQWDELWRRGAVERAKELKDQKAKVRLEKKMTKIEKFWRKSSGVKSTSIKGNSPRKEKPLENSAQAQKDALAKGAALKKYLQKNDCFMIDLLMVCVSMDICAEDDIVKIEDNKSFDELYRQVRVARAQDLKDNTARIRMEKQMTKFEKLWRSKTGIKKTSIKSKSEEKEAPPLENSAQAQKDALAKGKELKKYLQKNDCFMIDLLMVCVSMDICSEGDLEKIESNESFDELYRQVRVARAQDLKDNDARIRMEKQMTKFEKLWRSKTGIKKTSIQKGKKDNKKKHPKDVSSDNLSGSQLKQWMRKNDVWEMALYDELMSRQIDDAEMLKDMDQQTFDNIVRKVRVERFSELKDQKARQRADKLLVKFEKLWRKKSGIKSTSIK